MEDAAKIVYAVMQELMPLGKEYPWVEGGNSNAQDTARRTAAKLPLLTPEQGAVIAAAKAVDDASATNWRHAGWTEPWVKAITALREAVTALRAREGA